MFAGKLHASVLQRILASHVCVCFVTRTPAPIRAVKEAIDRGYLGDLNPTPWAFMLGNCTGWVAYSFLINVRKQRLQSQNQVTFFVLLFRVCVQPQLSSFFVLSLLFCRHRISLCFLPMLRV